jgi:tetratricopeptide (TPR) repeat protein
MRAIASALLLLFAAPALAQTGDEDDFSASEDLYVRRRPPTAQSIEVPKTLEPRIKEKEKLALEKRKQAIKLLEEFLATKPEGEGAAEGLFKLAELYWEEARQQFIMASQRYDRDVEACRERTERCKKAPKVPKLDLAKSERLYLRLVDEHPKFRRIDLVLYLLGFAATEDGRHEAALGWFDRVIKEHPGSRLFTDAWMMVGEYHFGVTNDFKEARDAYAIVLEHPESPVYDLALFKSAWCDWKLGETKRAAKRFKEVLDLAKQAEESGTESERKRRSQLRDEALNYLIVIFTEDDKVTAKDAYDFLASIDGESYGREMLVKLADTFFAQTRYERAVEAYKFLIELDPYHPDAPKYQLAIVEAWVFVNDYERGVEEAQRLANEYGPESAWAKANKDRPKTVKKAWRTAELALRTLGKRLHMEAQQWEEATKKAPVAKYQRAAEVYAFYLERFTKDENAVEIRYLRAEILYWKLKKNEEAGDEYLAVGKTAPIGKYHKDALLKAMDAYEKARPTNVTGRRELTAADRKFAEATDLYATLFPADQEIVTVIFKNGQMFYDYGDYDEAVKRFGLIVTKYDDHPDAGAAGDRILEALVKGQDYENVEFWARKLKGAKAFKSRQEQARLDRLILDSINKSGDKYAAAGKYEQAAGFYLRVAKEYPKSERAPVALFNAGVVFEKAQLPEKAAQTYLEVAKKYPKAKEAPKAAFVAAQVYEQMAYYDKAADAYALVATKYEDDTQYASDATYNAGALEQAQGHPKQAIKFYQLYAKKFANKDDAEQVAFRIGVVYEEAGDHASAAGAFRGYAARYKRGDHVIQAHTRAARAALKLGKEKQAAEDLAAAVKLWKAAGKDQKRTSRWGAEARYLQGELVFQDYQRVSLDVKPRQLKKQLDKKSNLLADAQEIYTSVIDYGDAGQAAGALHRIGQLYEGFASELRSAPVPKGLTGEEEELYRQELETYVIQVEEKAIEAYSIGYKRAIELRIYNQFTKNLRQALSKLSSTEYPPENEVRAGTRRGDRPPEPEVIKDVVRDE